MPRFEVMRPSRPLSEDHFDVVCWLPVVLTYSPEELAAMLEEARYRWLEQDGKQHFT